MSVIGKIKAVHPGWWISLFFGLMIGANIIFFIIAGNTEPHVLEKSGDSWVVIGAEATKSHPKIPAVDRRPGATNNRDAPAPSDGGPADGASDQGARKGDGD